MLVEAKTHTATACGPEEINKEQHMTDQNILFLPSIAGGKDAWSRNRIPSSVAVVIAFFICWAPFHAQRLMAVYITEPTEADYEIYSYLTNVSGVCYYVSATINPILYSILSLKFRHAFRDTLGRCLGRGSALRRRDRHRTMSFFNSTLKSGLEMTEDFTIVSEVPGHDHSQINHNGGHSTGRKNTRLSMVKNMDLMDGNFSNNRPAKKTSSTISNASMQMVEAFDDSNISEYIDQMKETQT
ncbi:unnamed protein product [Larinioides sclopetarius]|uniref:G-protein coupled receptors family 1 profile domain-containing protein n=1 Tax=Larinioides sclopetarius TaxID=280406 RepID=A0AAV2ABS8_9ARAC